MSLILNLCRLEFSEWNKGGGDNKAWLYEIQRRLIVSNSGKISSFIKKKGSNFIGKDGDMLLLHWLVQVQPRKASAACTGCS